MSLSSPSAWCCLPGRTSHNKAVSDFTHMPLSCFHIANTDIRTGTEACLKTHTQRIHWWESCGWMNIFSFLIFCHFQSPSGLWLELSISVCCKGWPYQRTPWQAYSGTHTQTLFGLKLVNFLTKWNANASGGILYFMWVYMRASAFLFSRRKHLAFGYWVFMVHVYFSLVIYNSISSVQWCASYLQNTKQSPNPIVFQSN